MLFSANIYETNKSWQPHGRAFKVHDRKRFLTEVMPKFFKQTKFSSFTRQLSIYGFNRLGCCGPDKGAYYDECFLQGMPDLCHHVQKIPKTKTKDGLYLPIFSSSARSYEPDFFSMPPAVSSSKTSTTLATTDDDSENKSTTDDDSGNKNI